MHQTATSTPLPTPTPLPTLLRIRHSLEDPSTDRPGPLPYVAGTQADRLKRVKSMSSPLRRGAHESWWTAEQGWFNAVAKTIPTYRVLNEEGRPVKGAIVPDLSKEEALKM